MDILKKYDFKWELEEELKRYVIEENAKVNFMGVEPNSKLPIVLNRYKYFIYDGMSKILLETAACCLVCIYTDTNGVNEEI